MELIPCWLKRQRVTQSPGNLSTAVWSTLLQQYGLCQVLWNGYDWLYTKTCGIMHAKTDTILIALIYNQWRNSKKKYGGNEELISMRGHGNTAVQAVLKYCIWSRTHSDENCQNILQSLDYITPFHLILLASQHLQSNWNRCYPSKC